MCDSLVIFIIDCFILPFSSLRLSVLINFHGVFYTSVFALTALETEQTILDSSLLFRLC